MLAEAHTYTTDSVHAWLTIISLSPFPVTPCLHPTTHTHTPQQTHAQQHPAFCMCIHTQQRHPSTRHDLDHGRTIMHMLGSPWCTLMPTSTSTLTRVDPPTIHTHSHTHRNAKMFAARQLFARTSALRPTMAGVMSRPAVQVCIYMCVCVLVCWCVCA